MRGSEGGGYDGPKNHFLHNWFGTLHPLGGGPLLVTARESRNRRACVSGEMEPRAIVEKDGSIIAE